MKLHLNLSLRRALLAAMAAVATFASTATAGIVDTRYDLQYYLDFSRNAGAFSAGATNVTVGYSDGSATYTIPLMPYLGSFAQVTDSVSLSLGSIATNGGAALVSSQFVYGAEHVFSVAKSKFDNGQMRYTFTDENGSASTAEVYTPVNIDNFGHDGGVSRTTKLVTAVAYTPMASDAFMATLNSSTWLYRLGNGGYWDSTGSTITTNNNAIGGIINMDSYKQQANGDWYLYGVFRENGTEKDPKTPLDTGVFSGDSGSPLFAWDKGQDRFVFVGALWASNLVKGFGNDVYGRFNPTLAQAAMDKYTINATFSGTDTIVWSASHAETGEGTLTQGENVINYTGKGTANAMADTKGLSFATDSEQQQKIQLQGNVNMGAGALTFTKGDWKLTEDEAADYTLSSAGFEVQKGASLTLELTGTTSEEIRKVGEGTMTIAGSGNNEAALVVGGGTVKYELSYDEEGNITGCTLGNAGETRLNRQNGYAASSVRLEGGVAIIVLMGDGQFKTNSVGGDTFTFGNDGGLLNLNGHNLEWGVIQQESSGKGARIGNFTPLGEKTPGHANFTYTGSGQFDGCFVDESNAANDGKAQLAVVYKGGANDTWKLTGNNTNVGGYSVQSGTMVLEGLKTHHVWKSDANDWTLASIEGSDITVKNGAAFQLSHHAQLVGDVIVEGNGSFIMNQAVNADYESISGGSKINMAGKEIPSMIGDVRLNGNSSTMTANVQSSAITKIVGSIRMENYDWDASHTLQFVKEGNGILAVSGNVGVPVVEIRGGGLVIEQANALDWYQWTIGKEGFLAAVGVDHSAALDYKINITSDGVFALTYDQTSALNLANKQNLYIGAWGEVHYGNANASLSANDAGNWLLGGGTGTLIVDFMLTGDNDLIVGNEWSSGTVHLTNTANDIKDIYIKGTGNKLTYENVAALGGATISLTYGNALGLYDANMLDVVNMNSSGVLALASSADLNLAGRNLAIGALNDLTYQGNISLSEGDAYRFGGSGNLTVDTELKASDKMQIDGQGTTGSSVTLARENAFTGDIIVGGGLELETPNSQGNIALHAGHSSALASANSINLQKGADFYTDGQNLMAQNLSAQSGSTISNNGNSNSSLVLYVTEGVDTSIADGVLSDQYNAANLTLVKAGAGTLKMEANSNWSGGLVIEGGKVVVKTSGDKTAAGGIGSTNNTVFVGDGAVLRVEVAKRAGYNLYGTRLVQTVTGTGTIELASGGAAVLTSQGTAFEGTVHVMDNTRLYMSSELVAGQTVFNNLSALNKADIKVDSGSQVRVTTNLQTVSNTLINAYSDFYISGYGFAGSDSGLVQSGLRDGALAIDCAATVWGNVTLLADASISSSSYDPTNTKHYPGYSVPYNCTDTHSDLGLNQHYGVKGALGGTIRGRILSDNHAELTIQGNEGITITADSDNTFGDLKIAGGLILNKGFHDGFALRLDGGKAVSQTSTALGTGHVTLNDGLVLRLAGTGTADQADVVYTYANNITAGDGATLQSYNITNKLTGVVTAAGDLNLATAQGGVLNLAGGVSGTGTLNIGAGSDIILGSSTGATFEGSVSAGNGASLTLGSTSALSASATITGTDSFTLNLEGTTDYTIRQISFTGENSALTLHFDFTGVPTAEDNTTWSTLNSSVSATTTTIALDLNMFNDISKGNYTLITSAGTGAYQLADTMNGRLELVTNDSGALVLVVDADKRLYWRTDGASNRWNTTDANWYSDYAAGKTTFTANANIMLDMSGVETDNSASARETIQLNDSLELGTMAVRHAAYEINGNGAITGTSLTVGNKGDLKLGVDATFTDGVLVNDARLEVDANTLTANVTAENKAQVALNGTAVQGNITVRENSTVALDASSVTGSIAVSEESSLSMNNASVSGSINLSGTGSIITENNRNSEGSGVARLSGSLNADGSGSLSLIDGSVTLNHTIALDSLSIAGGKTVTIWNAEAASGADKNIKSVELGAGAVLQSNDRAEMTSSTGLGIVQLNGNSATIQDVHHSGSFTVDTLKLGAGISSATLNLKKQAASTWSTLFKLGNETSESGNFAGTIALNESHNGSKRSAFLILGNKDIAKNAVIDLLEAQSADAHIGLGINTASATIAGLNSTAADAGQAKLFSGTINEKTAWNTGDTSAPSTVGTALRTLTIDTVTGGNYTFHGEVLGNLNLVKDGAGKQTFSGNSAKFNGSIKILDGTLALTGDALNMLSTASRVDVNGGTLDLSAMNFDISGGISLSSTFSISETGALQFGNLSKDTTYSIFDLTGGGQLSGWDTLTASNFIINGVNLGATTRTSVQVSMDGSFSYSILEDREVTWTGGSTTSTWSEKDTIPSWTTGEPAESTAFVNFDSVVFNSDADLTLEGSIHVNDLTLSEDVSLKTSGQLTVHGKTTLGNGFSWDFSGDTTLKFTEDQLKSASRIVVGEGATLVMTDKATTQNNTSSAFKNVSGVGNVVLNLANDNGIGFDLRGVTGDITVATGRLQINTSMFNETSSIRLASSSSELVFNNSCELKNDVILDADTTFHVNTPSSGVYEGRISGDLLGEERTLRKSGGSNLILAGRTVLKELETNTGKVIIDSTSAYIETVDGDIGNTAGGSLELAQNAILNVTGDVLSRSNTGIHLKKGAVLALLGHGVTIINEKGGNTGEDTASVKATTSNGQKYSLASTNYEVKDARVVYTGSEDATLSNKLTNVTLENSISNAAAPALEDGSESTFYAGSTLRVTNADNTLNGVIAYGGDVALHNLQNGTSLNLLEIATGRTVSAYVGSQTDEKSGITITGRTLLSGGATLNSNLTLAEGATLDMANLYDSTVILDGALTFGGQVQLGENVLSVIKGLDSIGDKQILFAGLSGVDFTAVAPGNLESTQVLACSLFSNIDNQDLYVNYQVIDNVGILMVVHVPEPATSTLSLLALSALAARRRRK